jgi:PPM family protein phosphatase
MPSQPDRTTFKPPCPLLRFGAASDMGKVRQNNEDAWLADAEAGVFILADGMGGQQAGELASRMVVEVLPKLLAQRVGRLFRPRPRALRYWLPRVLAELSYGVWQASHAHATLRGMGSTVVLALVRDGRVHVAHLGDSRAYLLRRGVLLRLTDDHSVVAMLLRAGAISPEEALVHPSRGAITRFVGMEQPVPADICTLELRAGDRLLLCSDGLTDMLGEPDLAELLTAHDPQRAANALVATANAAGGFDNITAVVVEWEKGSSP